MSTSTRGKDVRSLKELAEGTASSGAETTPLASAETKNSIELQSMKGLSSTNLIGLSWVEVPKAATYTVEVTANEAAASVIFSKSNLIEAKVEFEVGSSVQSVYVRVLALDLTNNTIATIQGKVELVFSAEKSPEASESPAVSPTPTADPLPTVTLDGSDNAPAFVNAAGISALAIGGSCTALDQPVTIIVSSEASSTATANCEDGIFSALLDLSRESDGPLQIRAYQISLLGISGIEASIIVRKDTVPPGTFAVQNLPSAPISTHTPAFSWTTAVDAVSLGVKIGADSTCSTGIVFDQTATVSSITTSTLSDGAYYLCVVAYDMAGNSRIATNSGAAFTIDTTPPGAFAFAVAPLLATSTPTLSWQPSAGASTYTLKISSAAGCAGNAATLAGLTATHATPNVLADGTYYACVTAYDAAGNAASATSNDAAFTIDTTPPAAFLLTAASLFATPTPDVSWGTSGGASRYTLKIGSASGCSGDVATLSDLSATHSLLASLPDATYRMCVTARDAAGNTTAAANNDAAFTIDTTPPAAFALSAFSSPTSSHTPQITWNGSADAVRYDLVFGREPSCAWNVETIDAGTSLTSSPANLASGVYFVCVFAYDQAGNRRVATGSGNKIHITGTPGATLWDARGAEATARYSSESATAAAVDPATGDVYIAAHGDNLVSGTSSKDWWIKKFDKDGVEITSGWNKRLDNGNGGDDIPMGIAVDASGNVYIVGNAYDYTCENGQKIWWIKKYSSAGSEATGWDKRAKPAGFPCASGSHSATDVAIDSSGNIYVSGYQSDGAGTGQGLIGWWIQKFLPNGTEITSGWDKHIANSFSYWGGAKGVHLGIGPSDVVYVFGDGVNLVGTSSNSDLIVRKFQSDGTEIVAGAWPLKIDNNSRADYAGNMIVTPTGELILASTTSAGGATNYGVIRVTRIDTAGSIDASFDHFSEAQYYGVSATALARDPSGNIFLCATSSGLSSTYSSDGILKKFASDGTEFVGAQVITPSRRCGALVALPDSSGLIEAENGSNMVATNSNDDFRVLKRGLDGSELSGSATVFNRTLYTNGSISASVADGLGNVYVAIYDYSTGSYVRKLAPDGAPFGGNWPYRFPNTENFRPTVLTLDQNSNLYVGGDFCSTNAGVESCGWRIVKITPSGEPIGSGWPVSIGLSTVGASIGAMKVDATGNLYVVGSHYNWDQANGINTQDDWVIKKFANDGTEITAGWNKRYSGTYFGFTGDTANAIAIAPDGSVYVGGQMGVNSFGGDFAIKKFAPNGTEVVSGGWPLTLNNGNLRSTVLGLAVDAAGSVYAAGLRSAWVAIGSGAFSGDNQGWIKKYFADGTEAGGWNKAIASPNGFYSQASIRSIVWDGSNSIYVLGQGKDFLTAGSSRDIFLKRYALDGTEDVGWSKIIDSVGPGRDDFARTLDLTAEGDLIITGNGANLTGQLMGSEPRVLKLVGP